MYNKSDCKINTCFIARNHNTNIMLGLYFFCDWHYDSKKFEGITERLSNLICWKLDKIKFMDIIYSRDKVNYYKGNDFILKDLTENYFIQTSNKLNSQLNSQFNREKAEFNLFTEIVLKVCEKNKSWLSNCLFTSNPNYKRHESYN